MHEAPLAVPEIDSYDEMAQDRIGRALRAKSAAAERVRRLHASVKPVEFKVRAGDVTITQKGYRYVS